MYNFFYYKYYRYKEIDQEVFLQKLNNKHRTSENCYI